MKCCALTIALITAVFSPSAFAFYGSYNKGCQTINVEEGKRLDSTNIELTWPVNPAASRYFVRLYDPQTKTSYGPNTTYSNSAYVTGLPDDGRKLLLYCYEYIGGWQRSIWEIYAFDNATDVLTESEQNIVSSIIETNEKMKSIELLLFTLAATFAVFSGYKTGLAR